MFQKMIAVFMSVCIAAALIAGIGTCLSAENAHSEVTMCDLEEEKVLY